MGGALGTQSVTKERGEEGLSPDNQENMERRRKLQSREQLPRPEYKIPSLEALLAARS